MAAPHGRLFFNEIFKIVNLSAFMLASLTIIEPKGLQFRVTPKNEHGGLPWPFLVVPVVLLLVNLTAAGTGFAIALMRFEVHMGAILLTTSFATYFSMVAAVALMHAFQRREVTEQFAFPVRLDAELTNGSHRQAVWIERLNQSHAFVRAPSKAILRTAKHLHIPMLGLNLLPVQIVGVASGEEETDMTVVKLAFDHLDDAHRRVLDKYFFETAIPLFFSRFTNTPVHHDGGIRSKGEQFIVDPTGDFGKRTGEIFLPVRGGML
jgi:hypothetical protein